MIFDPLERFLSSMAIFILFFCSIFHFSRGLKKENKNEKILMLGFGAFWFNIALTRLFFFIIDYFLEGTYIGDLNVIIQTYDIVNYIILYFYLYLFYYIFIDTIIVMLMFIWSSFKSKREFQAISSVITLGFATFLIGWSFEAILIKNSNLFSPVLCPIFIIIGVFIATSPLIGHFELFSRPIIKILILIMISSLAVFVSLTIFYNLQLIILLLIVIWTAFITLILIIGYLIYFYTRKGESATKEEEFHETLRIFTKPLKFNVEDVKYSREKGFCLVCKNKISGLSYVCPKCEAWYCLKCCEALTKLENVCWGCETPFTKFKYIEKVE
ncbi:MAG: hypothetical protein ACFFFT_15150 [Candidatus Thorarchaeota archaeon]